MNLEIRENIYIDLTSFFILHFISLFTTSKFRKIFLLSKLGIALKFL